MKILMFLKKDWLFTISFLLAIASCLYGKFAISYIDVKMIFSLFGLMLVIKSFERVGVLNVLAEKMIRSAKSTRVLVRRLVWLAFFRP
ncbi:hypothetical protein [Listeria sp. PSOL-1]|uniref:hypothetical protein n=1 Tax=Listeria sp. PSOL-1 TaxID=1844999 RepID=UPI0013D572AF|nr:hypothetical protein [Listeria sp. PSOL-1]